MVVSHSVSKHLGAEGREEQSGDTRTGPVRAAPPAMGPRRPGVRPLTPGRARDSAFCRRSLRGEQQHKPRGAAGQTAAAAPSQPVRGHGDAGLGRGSACGAELWRGNGPAHPAREDALCLHPAGTLPVTPAPGRPCPTCCGERKPNRNLVLLIACYRVTCLQKHGRANLPRRERE